jgi:hypothetical protein
MNKPTKVQTVIFLLSILALCLICIASIDKINTINNNRNKNNISTQEIIKVSTSTIVLNEKQLLVEQQVTPTQTYIPINILPVVTITVTSSYTSYPTTTNTVQPTIDIYANWPSSATGKCDDGTFTESENKRGACSHHGGVSIWRGNE